MFTETEKRIQIKIYFQAVPNVTNSRKTKTPIKFGCYKKYEMHYDHTKKN